MATLPLIQDDLYEAVNGEWLEKAVIPEDKPFTGGFADLDQGVEKQLMEDFEAFAKGEKTTDIEEVLRAVELYKKVLDVARRNEEGIAPALPFLSCIETMKTPEDLNVNAKNFLLGKGELPFQLGVDVDMADGTKHSFIIAGPRTILPDVTYYQMPQGEQLLQIYSMMAKTALAATPLSSEDQELFLKDTLAFDALVAKKVKSQVEWADYVNNYNPMPVDEVQGYVAPFDLKGLLKELYGDKAPETIIVYDPRAIKEANGYFSAENFPLYVHWSYVRSLLSASPFLSEALASNANTFRRILMGVATDPTIEKQAYRQASNVFSGPVGLYYGRTYFGEEAKKDVVSIVKRIVKMYQQRIAENTFLAESTKKTAIHKLDTMVIKMGYPEGVEEKFKELRFNEEDSYFEAMLKIEYTRGRRNLDNLLRPVDRTEWAMPGHMVNACYNPSANDITFPAAILQAPFYSIHQSLSENLGGIGAVIGHEISHAFDNNGAHFDENGNLADWWTPEDYERFKELTQKMIEQWDGIPYHGDKVNGTLVVSENIADNGGMAVTLNIMDELEEKDYQAYFKNWARVWCMKAKEEYIILLLHNDVHSPAKLRANIPPRNFHQWYEAFDVKETNEMFIPEDKRLVIW